MDFDASNFLRQVKYCRLRILIVILKRAHEHWLVNKYKVQIQNLQLLYLFFFLLLLIFRAKINIFLKYGNQLIFLTY